MTPHLSRLLLAFIILTASGLAQTKVIREEYPDGTTKSQYRIDAKGRRHGTYADFYPNGKVMRRGRFTKGIPTGKYEAWFASGKLFVTVTLNSKGVVQSVKQRDEKGEIVHELSTKRGQLLIEAKDLRAVSAFPRSRDEILSKLKKIDPPLKPAPVKNWRPTPTEYSKAPSLDVPFSAGKPRDVNLQKALRRASAYRYLSFVEPDLVMSDEHNRLAQHAALVCALNGDIDHNPPRPSSLPNDLFQLGSQGAKESNLHQGQPDLATSVDGYMDDSDPSNIARVGHRRWILSPSMKKTGFGMVEGFCAMHVHDSSRRKQGPVATAYPAPGHYPLEYIRGPHVAWHYSFDDRRVRPNGDEPMGVKVWLLDEYLTRRQELRVEDIRFSSESRGGGPALIFRPIFPKGSYKAGLAVLIQIQGIKLPKKAAPTYMVRLFSLNEGDAKTPPRKNE